METPSPSVSGCDASNSSSLLSCQESCSASKPADCVKVASPTADATSAESTKKPLPKFNVNISRSVTVNSVT